MAEEIPLDERLGRASETFADNDVPLGWSPAFLSARQTIRAAERRVFKAAAILDVIAERTRRVSVEGWTPEHDDSHDGGELALAGAAYAVAGTLPEERRRSVSGIYSIANNVTLRELWPWSAEWWKPKDRRRDLVRAAALIIAEIERLNRMAAAEKAAPNA